MPDAVIELDRLTKFYGPHRGIEDVDLVVEAATEGIVAVGAVRGESRVPCRRCLDDVIEPLEVEMREIFERHPTEGETWPIEDERIDLTPAVRELALLGLPLAPVCREDCAGPEMEGGADDLKARCVGA